MSFQADKNCKQQGLTNRKWLGVPRRCFILPSVSTVHLNTIFLEGGESVSPGSRTWGVTFGMQNAIRLNSFQTLGPLCDRRGVGAA